MSFLYHEKTSEHSTPELKGINVFFVIAGLVILLIVILMSFMPVYNVWQQEQEGKAEYAKAEQNRRIRILEAEALKDSAKLQAEAEVEKAKGLAQANEIVAEGLEGHDEYLRYLWITHLEQGENREVIYIPTEAGLPILEAGKR